MPLYTFCFQVAKRSNLQPVKVNTGAEENAKTLKECPKMVRNLYELDEFSERMDSSHGRLQFRQIVSGITCDVSPTKCLKLIDSP